VIMAGVKHSSAKAPYRPGAARANIRRTRMVTRLEWYAVRCVFQHKSLRPRGRKKHVYEERIIAVCATTEGVAIRNAEALEYEGDSGAVRYLGFAESYRMSGPPSVSGAELFSLMRSSSLCPARFISQYFDDGSEHRRT